MLRALFLAASAASLAPLASAQWVLANYDTGLLGVDDAEFTPDGRLLVIRDDTAATTVKVYDAATGAELMSYQATGGPTWTGTCHDAVGVTNERAIVIGSLAMVFDLGTLTLIAEHDVGAEPRDVAVTPDGSLAAVRGGDALYVIDMLGGGIVAQAPGLPAEYLDTFAFDVDSVVASDEHAVFTSELVNGGARSTRVTIFDLHPAGGGPPAVVYQTTTADDQDGKPNDIALLPDGLHAAVRSDFEVGLYDLAGAGSAQAWRRGLVSDPGPFFGHTLDSIEVAGDRIATIGRRLDAVHTTALDLFDLTGRQKYALLTGEPHDLALTRDGRRLGVRTSHTVTLFDVEDWPAGDILDPLDQVGFSSTHTSWNAGLDSIVATEDRLAALARTGQGAKVGVWDVSEDRLDPFFSAVHDDKSLDLDVSPDGGRVIFGFFTSLLVVDLRTGALVLDADGDDATGHVPWCDGVAIDGEHAAAFGVSWVNGNGWISIVDLFEQPARYCPSNPNSTGEAGELVVSGSASFGANDLVLWAASLPPHAVGVFAYGDQRIQVPFGAGFACVGGHIARFKVTQASAAGVSSKVVDYTNLPPNGGVILPGTSWNFQHLYRDAQAATFNLTDALAIQFGN